MTFEEKVRSMKASELVQTMVNGLKKEWVKVDMDTFGNVEGDICVGCAATNALCELMGRPFTTKEVGNYLRRAKTLDASINVIDDLESMFNSLRTGDLGLANYCVKTISDTSFPIPPFSLPHLTTDNYKEGLPAYQKYADWLNEQGL